MTPGGKMPSVTESRRLPTQSLAGAMMKKERREGHRDLSDAGDDRVDPAAVVAGGRAGDVPGNHRGEGREDGHLERDAPA